MIRVPGPSMKITPALNGEILNLGNAGAENLAFGGFGIDIVPSGDFTGGFSPLGRSAILDASDDDLSFVMWPFRAFYLNGTPPASFALQTISDSIQITGRSYIVVPAPGIAVGLLVACSTGTCDLYWQQMHGNTIP